MNPNPTLRPRGRVASGGAKSRSLSVILLAAMCALSAPVVMGQEAAATGTVSGRVKSQSSDRYLPRAVVTVPGTSIRVLTDEFGNFELPALPAGTVTVEVSYTGQETQSLTLDVAAGQTVTREVVLLRKGEVTNKGDDGAIVLTEYTVETERFRNAQELAINEERNSTNIKDVVSADAFGHVPGGNLGEFVKFLPGVETEYGDADAFANAGIGGVNQSTASQISVRGFGAADTAITIDGMPLSGISPAGLTRAVGLDMISVNNAARIEVIKVARPDMPNESAGATINLVTKSAFEYGKPQVNVAANVVFNTDERGNPLKKQPGPGNKNSFHTLPGGQVSVIMPLSSKIGLTVSGASANSYSPNRQVSMNWQSSTTTFTRSVSGASTILTVKDAGGNVSDLANPYLRQMTFVNNPWIDYKNSGSIKFDWRPIPHLTTSTTYSASTYTGLNVNRRLQFAAGRPSDWGDDYVIGTKYVAATSSPSVGALDGGNAGAMEVTSRERDGFTQQAYFKADYVRGPWTIAASAGMSEAFGAFRDTENDHFARSALSLSNVGQTVMTGIKDGVPSSIVLYNRSGNVIDYSQMSNWTLDNASALEVATQRSFQRDKEQNYKGSIRRRLDFLPFDASFEVGASRRVKEQRKWGLGTGGKIRYTGPTLTAAAIRDDVYTQGAGYTMSQRQEWADVYKLYDIYKAHPEYFNADYDVTYSIANYRTETTQNKSVKETSDAGYAMFEGTVFKSRLSYLVGIRQTRSGISGYQSYTDPKWNYVKNADGTIYTDSVYVNGVKFDGSTFATATGASVRDVIVTDTALQARLKAAGISYPDHLVLAAGGATATTANSLEATKLQLYRRTLRSVSRTNPETPSASLSYKITDNLILRPAWSRETQMPALDAGNATSSTTGLLGGFQINPSVTPTADLGGDGTINVSNPGLKPQEVTSYNMRLDYYTKNGGSLSGTYYIKDIKNQWETQDLYNTSPDYQEVLNSLGLDTASYDNWKISTTINGLEQARQKGYELSFRQNFGFLGQYGRFFNAFGNYSHKTRKESTKAGVATLPTSAADLWAGGLNMSTSKFSVSARMTFVGSSLTKNGTQIYNGTTYQIYTEIPDEYKLDLEAGYIINKTWNFLVSGKNVLNSERTRYRRDAGGFIPTYAEVSSNNKFGVSVTAQLSAQF